MPKISVIIPVYNDGKYISETLDSVIAQTFTDWEAICVNDGSTDNSLKILKQYAKRDKRIHIIDQKNQGVIVARTNAIKKANSEYLFMLDGDDKIAPKTLEKMYNAITDNKGDIITSRVMQFGEKNGEMLLLKPNKVNMADYNCLVNAALFKKSDFIACGGFDERFSSMLEDYDLWLNLVYNHNKKIYRIPEILFYYRIKPKNLSRNYQKRAVEYDKIMNLLHKKYPMRKWHKIRNILCYPQKIARFFFRIEHHKIKVLKIPVYTICKYDTVISVGAACFVPEVLKELKLRDFSGPFDWMFGSDILTRLDFVKNRFKDYFNFEDFEYVGPNPDNGKAVYKNNRSGIVYNHDFPNGDFKDVFEPVAQKYARRINRTIFHLDNDKKVLLVFSELGQSCDVKKLIKSIDSINKKYKADIDLLYINNNKHIELGDFIKPKRISEHIIYAEYHYEKYPDELPQARNICKKIVKKVAK